MKHARLVAELIANFALPWLAYRLAAPHWGEVGGLIASSVPPLLWSGVELWQHRRLDALSVIVLAGIVLSVLAMLAGGDARMLLVRESLVSGLIGVAFLGSLLASRPLLYYLIRATLQRRGNDSTEKFAQWWAQPQARTLCTAMSWAWGLGLVGEAALRTWLAWHWTAERFLALAPIASYVIMGGLAAWSWWYPRRLRRSA